LGEDIPLHIAIQNFDAPVPVYYADPVLDPCGLIQIEVRDIYRRTLAREERVMSHSVCMDHGFGPKLYPKGQIVPLERSLKRKGWLPNRPGTYMIVVTWAPSTSAANDSSVTSAPLTLVPYAVAEANATIDIVESEP
jgi:hypothetical protein